MSILGKKSRVTRGFSGIYTLATHLQSTIFTVFVDIFSIFDNLINIAIPSAACSW
jgi:hypothetical protein